MRVGGRNPNPLFLGLLVSLSIAALVTITPVQAAKSGGGGGGGSTTYFCSVAVTYFPGTFAVQTTVTATSGSLPGPTETDYVSSYRNGVLYNSQSVTYSVARNTATTTVIVPVPSNGVGVYTFQSTIISSRGIQLATCTGTYSL